VCREIHLEADAAGIPTRSEEYCPAE